MTFKASPSASLPTAAPTTPPPTRPEEATSTARFSGVPTPLTTGAPSGSASARAAAITGTARPSAALGQQLLDGLGLAGGRLQSGDHAQRHDREHRGGVDGQRHSTHVVHADRWYVHGAGEGDRCRGEYLHGHCHHLHVGQNRADG